MASEGCLERAAALAQATIASAVVTPAIVVDVAVVAVSGHTTPEKGGEQELQERTETAQQTADNATVLRQGGG